MILIPDKKIVIATPSKTASSTLMYHFCKGRDAMLCLGPQHDGIIEKHSPCMPHGCENWTKLLVVRDPYQRFLSMYGHYHATMPFSFTVMEFAWKALGRELGDFYTNISVAMGNFPYTDLVRVENLNEDLESHGLVPPTMRLNESDHPDKLTMDEAYLARIWGGADFDNYGYSKDYDANT